MPLDKRSVSGSFLANRHFNPNISHFGFATAGGAVEQQVARHVHVPAAPTVVPQPVHGVGQRVRWKSLSAIGRPSDEG